MDPKLADLVYRHKEIAREEKKKNGRLVFGTLCSYVPVEILHAFDILLVRLWGDGKNHERADALLPAYICPPARNIMAMGLAGDYDFLDVRDYRIDGAILHSNRSCRPISMGQMDIRRVLAEELSVPSVMFDGDHMDAEKFSMAQFQTRIDALMEMILEKKRASGSVA